MLVGFDDYVFDFRTHELRRNGRPVKVDPVQLDLLAVLMSNPGSFLTKHDVVDLVWHGRAISDNLLSVTIAKLRKALGHKLGERNYIESRYGHGYRFVPIVTRLDDTPETPPLEVTVAAPLVGRCDTLERLHTMLDRANRGGGGVCILLGEPGIGKTRMAEAFAGSAHERGARPLWGRWRRGEGTPLLWPFSEVLRELSGGRAVERALQSIKLAAERAASSPSSGEHTGSSVVGSCEHRAIDQVAQTLFRLTKQQPLAILLDNLQWADPLSVRLLRYIADDIARWPLVIVTMLRGNETSREIRTKPELSRLVSHRNTERIELGRLGPAEIDEYVLATRGEADPILSRQVFDLSEGVPFFMAELLRPTTACPEPRAATGLELSVFALDLVRQRLDELPTTAREILVAAAVIGRHFDLGLLGHVTAQDYDELLDALDTSIATGLVVQSIELRGLYAFSHDAIRKVLYADAPTLSRCRLHHRTAEALLQWRAAGRMVESAELANHYLMALPQGDVTVAIQHARDAATAAYEAGAASEACLFLRRAVDSLVLWVELDREVREPLVRELSRMERMLSEGAAPSSVRKESRPMSQSASQLRIVRP